MDEKEFYKRLKKLQEKYGKEYIITILAIHNTGEVINNQIKNNGKYWQMPIYINKSNF